MTKKKTLERPKLVVRMASTSDIDDIMALSERVYPSMPPYRPDVLRGQINKFPAGQFIAEFDGKIVGYCASLLVSEQRALAKHTWSEITGSGYASTHDPKGDVLYAMEVFVDPEMRGLRVGQRFYSARKQLCRHLRLRGIVFGGRLPGLKKRIKKVGTVERYIELVQQKKIRDQVLSFQLRQGFELLGLLEDYLPYDDESLGFATHMIWRNPEFSAAEVGECHGSPRVKDVIRVACVQYQQRRIADFSEFETIVEYFLDVTSDYKADFTVFPELFSMQLLSLENEEMQPDSAMVKIASYYETMRDLFRRLAIRYNVNVVAGSHPRINHRGEIQNVAIICLRDGSIHEQAKIHPTPSERYWWNMVGGDTISAIDTDCGPIGVLVCYDAEFPELTRNLVDQGANILFVPFCTDERQSYLRVRYCCQARAVESQCYVVMAGNVGNLPRVHNMELQYAQSAILTPCDFPFSRDGIAADSTPNVETVVFADVRLEDLFKARNEGTVRNLKDRRHDLYEFRWRGRRRS